MNPRSGHKIVEGSTVTSWLELNRLWLDDGRPENTASRAIACAFQVVRNVRPDVEWIQSFADERCGKLGAVYQACSFDYVGFHESKFFKIDDTWVHKSMLTRKQVDKRGWKQGPRVAWAQANADRAVPYTFKQYRYVKFLRPGARKRLLKPVLPYPKPFHAATCDPCLFRPSSAPCRSTVPGGAGVCCSLSMTPAAWRSRAAVRTVAS
jgi:hypothetical protein